jgi:hypothetical protein
LTKLQGDLPSIRENRGAPGRQAGADDRPSRAFDHELTDAELLVIAAGGRIEDKLELKVIPPPLKD